MMMVVAMMMFMIARTKAVVATHFKQKYALPR